MWTMDRQEILLLLLQVTRQQVVHVEILADQTVLWMHADVGVPRA